MLCECPGMSTEMKDWLHVVYGSCRKVTQARRGLASDRIQNHRAVHAEAQSTTPKRIAASLTMKPFEPVNNFNISSSSRDRYSFQFRAEFSFLQNYAKIWIWKSNFSIEHWLPSILKVFLNSKVTGVRATVIYTCIVPAWTAENTLMHFTQSNPPLHHFLLN